MAPLEDYANEFFTPEFLSLVFLLAYMSTQFFDGWFGNFISSIRRKNRRRIKKRSREPTAVPAQLRQRVPYRESHSAPTEEVTTSSPQPRIFRIIVILFTIQLLPAIFTELGLSDEISEIISYGILNNLSSYSWLQWSLILSVGYLIVESTFERKNFHLFAIPIVFLSAMVSEPTLWRPTPIFFAQSFLFISILQAMKVENSNITVFGLSSDIRDYIGQGKYPANLFAVSLIQGRQLKLTHARRHVDADGNIHLALANSRWSFLHDDPKDRSRGIFYWLLVVALVVIDVAFLDGSFADGDAAIIGILIYATLVFLALTYHGIIFATWVWYFISLYGFTEIFSEIPGTLIALAVIYIVFYSMRHYFNNREIMNITNLITPRPLNRDDSTLKEELRPHGWIGKIYIWIKLGICGLLNNLIVSLICVIQLFVGLLILIVNAVYLFITNWLRSFGFPVPMMEEDHDIIPPENVRYFFDLLPIVLTGIAVSIIHGILAPWISTYRLIGGLSGATTFSGGILPPDGTESPFQWYFFRNGPAFSESIDYPLIYYLAGIISWYISWSYIAVILVILLVIIIVVLFFAAAR